MAINFLFFGLEENCINLQHENEASFSSLLQELTYKQVCIIINYMGVL